MGYLALPLEYQVFSLCTVLVPFFFGGLSVGLFAGFEHFKTSFLMLFLLVVQKGRKVFDLLTLGFVVKFLLFFVQLSFSDLLVDPVFLLHLLHAESVAVALVFAVENARTRNVLTIFKHGSVATSRYVIHPLFLFPSVVFSILFLFSFLNLNYKV